MESIFFSFPSLPLSLSCLFTRTINLDGASGYATGFDRKGGEKKKIKKDTAIVRKRKYVSSVFSGSHARFCRNLFGRCERNVSHALWKLALDTISQAEVKLIRLFRRKVCNNVIIL